MMKRILKKLFGGGGRSSLSQRRATVAVKTISQAELDGMFLEAPGSKLFQGVLVALDQEVQDAAELCLDEELSNEKLRNRVGAMEGLLRFRRTLEDYEAKARRKESEQLQENAEDAEE